MTSNDKDYQWGRVKAYDQLRASLIDLYKVTKVNDTESQNYKIEITKKGVQDSSCTPFFVRDR